MQVFWKVVLFLLPFRVVGAVVEDFGRLLVLWISGLDVSLITLQSLTFMVLWG